jgi:hypothetical protein
MACYTLPPIIVTVILWEAFAKIAVLFASL